MVTYESIVVGFLALGLVIGLEVEVLGSGVHVLVLLAPLVLQAWELGAAHKERRVDFFLTSISFMCFFPPCAKSRLPLPYC